MAGIDRLISAHLSFEIKKGLDSQNLEQFEEELFLKYGMSIKLGMEYFKKFHSVYKKFTKLDASSFEKNCLKKIIRVKIDKNYKVSIVNQDLCRKIFGYFRNSDDGAILSSIMGQRLTIAEIIAKSGVSKSFVYREIEEWITAGLVLPIEKNKKGTSKISKYTCIFEKIAITMQNDKIDIDGIISKSIFEKSSIFKAGLFEK